ncbi:unnamed protein product [Heligmosomoides polygyrus]|uniref:Glyco_trans_4-like_N domain-containing protein n=1 Tax=Heligmosomoides polygyrus TaxID=6339 RepID=A0A183GRK8_HELPZ|nr:unnamed protein product [Heligmosomoides polygyrus]
MAQQGARQAWYPWKLFTGCGNGRSHGSTRSTACQFPKELITWCEHDKGGSSSECVDTAETMAQQGARQAWYPWKLIRGCGHGRSDGPTSDGKQVSVEAHHRVWKRQKRWPNKEHGKHGIRGSSSQGVETAEAMAQQGARLVSFRRSSSRGASTTRVVAQVFDKLRVEDFDLAIAHFHDLCPLAIAEKIGVKKVVWITHGTSIYDFAAQQLGLRTLPATVPHPLSSG